MLLLGNGHPWEAWERPEGGRSGGLYALSLRGFSGSSSLPPPDGASSSVGFHRSSCGFPSFSHPLKDLPLVSASVSSRHLPLLPSPCLPSRQGTGSRISWERLDHGSSCPSGGVERRKGASFLTPSPLPQKQRAGKREDFSLHQLAPSRVWLPLGPSPWPAVSQVGEDWRPGQAEACLLSLPPHRASSSCPAVCKTLAGSSFQRPLPLQPGPVAPGGGLTALASRLFCSHPCLKSGPEPPHRHPRVGGRPQTAGGGPSVGKGLGPGGWESRRRRGPCSQRLSALHTDLHVSRPGLTHGAVTHSSEK